MSAPAAGHPMGRLVSAVLAVIDRIGEMVAAIEAGEEFAGGDDSALIQALEPGAEGPAVAAAVAVADGKADRRAAHHPPVGRIARPGDERRVSDMVLARNELARRLRETESDVTVDGAFERLCGIIAEMRDAITRTRMQRIENLFVALPRMVRDLSGELGKQVLVDIDGGDVELDREMIEMIRDPLTHIIRNAVDHGIEKPGRSPQGRQARNRPAVGLGAPVGQPDPDRHRRRRQRHRRQETGRESGCRGQHRGGRRGQDDRARTACADFRGRPVDRQGGDLASPAAASGMDVVRSNVERIGGIVEVDSTPGNGTRMTLRVPLTLTIIPALTVSIGSQHFAIPRAAIEEIVRANGTSVTLDHIGGAGVATIRGRRMPEISLADVLGLPSDLADADRTLVVLRPAGGDLYALAVDEIHDHEELVVKPAAPAVMATGLYAGTTLADDGSPILLFDPAGLAEVGGVKLEAQERSARIAETSATAEVRDDNVLLFRGLDGKRRAIRLALVDRIEEVSRDCIRHAAGQLRVQLGETILPLAGADAVPDGDDKVRVFRLSDGRREIGYVFREVIDLMSIDHDVIPAEHAGPVSGVSLIGGEPAELVDAHWLFATHLGATARSARPAGLPPAVGRSVDPEHAPPDRRSGRLSRGRRATTS